MTSEPVSPNAGSPRSNAAAAEIDGHDGFARRAGRFVLREAREAVLPTVFFFIGFNLIVLTTNLLVAQYFVAVGSFMLATMAALVVGKSVLVANQLSIIRRYDRAPLIRPILFKTAVYWVIVFLARLLERFVHFSVLDHNPPGNFPSYLINTFSWPRFIAISLWILVLFLVYVTATEFSGLFGPGEIRRVMLTSRPSELQLNRRQRIRELLHLSRLADERSFEELANPATAAHRQFLDIMQRLARSDRVTSGTAT